MSIKFKRGLKVDLPTGQLGEPLYCTDTNELFIGQGVGNPAKLVQGKLPEVIGKNIMDIKKTKTEELIDTYTITYSDKSIFNFNVINGIKGEIGSRGPQGDQGIQGPEGPKGDDGLTVSVKVNGSVFNNVNGIVTLPSYPSDTNGGTMDLSPYQTKIDTSLTTAAKEIIPSINEINTQLKKTNEQFITKASKDEARLKTVKIELEDLSENTLGAMSGSSTFSLLSIPQDKSVTNVKLNLPKNILPKTFIFTKGDIDSSGNPVTTNYRCITDMISVKKGDYIGIVDTNNIKFKWAIYIDDTLSGFTSYRTEGYVFPNDAKIRIVQNKTDAPISDINYMNNNIYICDNETAMTKSEVLSKINENITPALPKNDTFYVAHDGLDTNDGLISTTPFATFEKAISSGATTIYAKKGNYYGTKIVASNLKKLKIISYGEGSYITLNNTDSLSPLVYPLVLTNIDELELNSIKITDAGVKGFKIWGCNGKLTNCICEKSTSDGFSLDGSNLKLYSCIAKNSARDGFNIHEYNGSACHTEFYNCKSYNSGDDGISHHENCTAYIQGGEFSNSVSGGVTPYGQAKVDVYNALIQNNGSGIHAFQSGTILDNPTINVVNCILKGNTTGIIAQYYNIISANTKFVENITNTNEISGTITTI